MTDIFEQIDHALEDWAVSEDAMRWAPEPPERAVGGIVYTAPVSTDGYYEWTDIGWTEDGNAHRSQLTYTCPPWLDSTVWEAANADWARAWTSVLRTASAIGLGLGARADGPGNTYAIMDETHHWQDVADEIKAATSVSAETLAACRDALAEDSTLGRGWRTDDFAADALDWKPA